MKQTIIAVGRASKDEIETEEKFRNAGGSKLPAAGDNGIISAVKDGYIPSCKIDSRHVGGVAPLLTAKLVSIWTDFQNSNLSQHLPITNLGLECWRGIMDIF